MKLSREYRRILKRYKPLTRAEEIELFRRARKGDRQARDRIVLSHLRLVLLIADRYSRSPGEGEDMVQEGMLALTRAADAFDPTRGRRFLNYAWSAVENAIARLNARECTQLSIPLFVAARMSAEERRFLPISGVVMTIVLESALDELPDGERRVVSGIYGLGGDPTPRAELARQLGMSRRTIGRMELAAIRRMRRRYGLSSAMAPAGNGEK